MTPEEQRQRELWLDRAGEPPLLSVGPRDLRPGKPIPEYDSRPLFTPAAVSFPRHGECQSPGCDHPAGDAYLCPACLDRAEVILANIPRLIPDLEAHAYGTVRFSGGGSGDGVRGISRASDLIHQVHAELVAAVRTLTEERGPIVDLPDDSDALAAWLLQHSRSIALDPAGPDILSGLDRWHEATLRAIDRPPDREYIGLCDGCSTPMHAPDDKPEYACPACRRVHDVRVQRDRISDRLRNVTATVGELEKLAKRAHPKVTRKQIEGLVRRGMLAQVGSSKPARYNVGALLDLLAERLARGA